MVICLQIRRGVICLQIRRGILPMSSSSPATFRYSRYVSIVSSLNMSFNSEIGSIINFNHVTEHANS
jgi:hypothetical protein